VVHKTEENDISPAVQGCQADRQGCQGRQLDDDQQVAVFAAHDIYRRLVALITNRSSCKVPTSKDRHHRPRAVSISRIRQIKGLLANGSELRNIRRNLDWVCSMPSRFWPRSKTAPPDDVNEVGRHSLGGRLLGVVFGYDFFISYSWSDGASYAAALTRQLRSQGFEVFFDRDDYASGDDWKKVGAWKLRRTGQLVLVGSPGALLSVPVIREIQIFSGTGRRIVPIDFDGTLEWKASGAPLAQYLPAEILRIREPAVALETGPSDQVVAAIRRTFNLVRQDKKRVNALTFIAFLLLGLAAAAVVQSVQATIARNVAEEQRDRAQRVLDQITASANTRVTAFAERAQAEKEITNIAGSEVGASPDLGRAAELITLSGRYFDNRNFAAALKAAQTAMGLVDTVSDIPQTGANPRLVKANGYQRIGLAKAQLGRLEEAASDLAMSLQLVQGVAGETPQDAKLRERLAAALVDIGDISVATQKFEDAERHFGQAIELRSEAADLRTSPEARRLLATTYNRIAGLQVARGQYGAATETSRLSISMLEQLRTERPDHRVLGDLSAAYDIRAKALDAAGNPGPALAWRDKDLAIIKQLADRDPDNIEWQHDLALSLDARGPVLERLGRNEAALEAYAQAIAVGDALRRRSRIPPDWLRDTAGILEQRGVLLNRLGRTADAVSDFRRSPAILEQIAYSFPATVSPSVLEAAYRRARTALLEANRWSEALETAEQQLFAISLAADRETRDFTRLAQVLSSVCWTALLARNTERAELAGWQAFALAPGLQITRLNYAHALMYSGNLEQAKKMYLDGLSAGGEEAVKWRKTIHADFAYLSARNLGHPLMAEIERDIGP
jgi:tetratricopeptide (TPR) repeat protein